MALVPSGADLLVTDTDPTEWADDETLIEARVPCIWRQPINVCAQALGLPIGIELSEVIIEGAVLLKHENDVVDDCGIAVPSIILIGAVASTTGQKGNHADTQ